MKKKSSSIVLLLWMVMLLTIVGCSNTSNSTIEDATEEMGSESFQLVLEPKGEYNKPGFGEEYGLYRFEGTELVVYQIADDAYLIGEDAGKNGKSYGNIFQRDSQLLAISDKYLLFDSAEGNVAIALEEKESPKVGENIYYKFFFDELPPEETERFLYVESYEKVANEYR